jgi:hypothetical protein
METTYFAFQNYKTKPKQSELCTKLYLKNKAKTFILLSELCTVLLENVGAVETHPDQWRPNLEF